MIKDKYTIEKINTFDTNYNTCDNDSENLSSLILSSIIAKNSSMKKPEPKKTSLFNLIFGKKPAKTTTTNETFDLLKAIHYLTHEYHPTDCCDDYIKIKLSDGTIIRIFDDEVQIDDTLLSLDDSAAILNALKPSTQKLVLDFVINIKL